MPHLRFYFDYLSPYAYLSHSQLRATSAAIAFHPFDIRALMPAVGNVPTSVICKPKNRYVRADLSRWAAHYAVPFARHPDIADIDHRRLLRATLCAAARGPVDDLVAALFTAMWGAPEPLTTTTDVSAAVRRAGVEGVGEDEIDDPRWDAALTRATEEAIVDGVFGAPTIFVGDEMFFGNDRMDFVRAALGRVV